VRRESVILGMDIFSDQDKREIMLEFIIKMGFLISDMFCPIGIIVVLILLRIELGREAKLELTDLIWRVRGSNNVLVIISEIDSIEI
jgi:hypothetical protein